MRLKSILALAVLAPLAACAQARANDGAVAAGGAALPEPAAPQPAEGGPPPMPAPVTLSARPNATGGEALYIEYCAMCHAPNGMGHGLLGRRLDVADLEDRDNLVKQYIELAVRRGIGNMPPLPRGELSDDKLDQIADYLVGGAQ